MFILKKNIYIYFNLFCKVEQVRVEGMLSIGPTLFSFCKGVLFFFGDF